MKALETRIVALDDPHPKSLSRLGWGGSAQSGQWTDAGQTHHFRWAGGGASDVVQGNLGRRAP